MRIGEVAEWFGVSVEAVRDWADKDKLRSWRTPGGERRFWRSEVEGFIPADEPTQVSEAS